MVSTSISISIVILNVVDHSVRLELNNTLNCNFIHSWHVLKCGTQFHHGCLLLPSFKNSSLMNSNSHLKAKQQVPLYLALLKLKHCHLKVRSNPYLQPGVAIPMCENTVHCFHFVIFTPNCKCHLSFWHSLRVSHLLKVWLAIVTPSTLYNSSCSQLSSFQSMLPQSINLINCISLSFSWFLKNLYHLVSRWLGFNIVMQGTCGSKTRSSLKPAPKSKKTKKSKGTAPEVIDITKPGSDEANIQLRHAKNQKLRDSILPGETLTVLELDKINSTEEGEDMPPPDTPEPII